MTVFGSAQAVELSDLEERSELAAQHTHPRRVGRTLHRLSDRGVRLPKGGLPLTYRHSFGREMVATALVNLTRRGGRGGKGYPDKSIRNQPGLLYSRMAAAVLDNRIPRESVRDIKLPRRIEHYRPSS